jgi:hypothetical protein
MWRRDGNVGLSNRNGNGTIVPLHARPRVTTIMRFSTTAGVDLMKVYKGTSILVLSIVITTVLLAVFPQIALWLPATMR